MLFLSLICNAIYAKFNGARNSLCHVNNPCNYKIAGQLLERGDNLFIWDKEISSMSQIEGLKSIVERSSRIGSHVIGRETEINLETCEKFKFLFDIKDSKEFMLSNFSFINAKTPIIKITNSKKVILSNITFSDSHFKNHSSMVMLLRSVVLLNNVSFTQNTFENTFLMKIDKSKIAMINSHFSQNVIFHQSSNPFIAIRRTNLVLKNSSMIGSSSQYSPFITEIEHSKVKVLNSFFRDEKYQEVIKSNSEGNEVIIEDSSFSSCHGNILFVGNRATGSITNVNIENCISPFGELFLVSNASSLIVSNTNIVRSSGINIFTCCDFRSMISINECNFQNNKVSNSFANATSGGIVSVLKSSISGNYAGEYLFAAALSSKINVKESLIEQNPSLLSFASNKSTVILANNRIKVGYNTQEPVIYTTDDSETKLEKNNFQEKFDSSKIVLGKETYSSNEL